jgi:hypothetical protein
MPMIAITISSSIRVKPDSRFFMDFPPIFRFNTPVAKAKIRPVLSVA